MSRHPLLMVRSIENIELLARVLYEAQHEMSALDGWDQLKPDTKESWRLNARRVLEKLAQEGGDTEKEVLRIRVAFLDGFLVGVRYSMPANLTESLKEQLKEEAKRQADSYIIERFIR